MDALFTWLGEGVSAYGHECFHQTPTGQEAAYWNAAYWKPGDNCCWCSIPRKRQPNTLQNDAQLCTVYHMLMREYFL